MPKMELVDAVRKFTVAVGCTTENYNVRQIALYTGLQLEEMAEKLDAIFGKGNPVAQEMHGFANDFKRGEWDAAVATAHRAGLLDADVDLAWVTVGSMLSQGADVEGAIAEVARANMSKLIVCPECGGNGRLVDASDLTGDCYRCGCLGLVAIKDENGKVKKPDSFVPPNIEPFVVQG